MVVASEMRGAKKRTPFRNRCTRVDDTRSNAIVKKKKTQRRALVQRKEMLPTIQHRTQVDDGYEHPAVLVLVIGNSYTLCLT